METVVSDYGVVMAVHGSDGILLLVLPLPILEPLQDLGGGVVVLLRLPADREYGVVVIEALHDIQGQEAVLDDAVLVDLVHLSGEGVEAVLRLLLRLPGHRSSLLTMVTSSTHLHMRAGTPSTNAVRKPSSVIPKGGSQGTSTKDPSSLRTVTRREAVIP